MSLRFVMVSGFIIVCLLAVLLGLTINEDQGAQDAVTAQLAAKIAVLERAVAELQEERRP